MPEEISGNNKLSGPTDSTKNRSGFTVFDSPDAQIVRDEIKGGRLVPAASHTDAFHVVNSEFDPPERALAEEVLPEK